MKKSLSSEILVGYWLRAEEVVIQSTER